MKIFQNSADEVFAQEMTENRIIGSSSKKMRPLARGREDDQKEDDAKSLYSLDVTSAPDKYVISGYGVPYLLYSIL